MHRRAKGAVKLYFTLDHDGYLPTFLVITDGKHHEGPMAREQSKARSHSVDSYSIGEMSFAHTSTMHHAPFLAGNAALSTLTTANLDSTDMWCELYTG